MKGARIRAPFIGFSFSIQLGAVSTAHGCGSHT